LQDPVRNYWRPDILGIKEPVDSPRRWAETDRQEWFQGQ
jgi:hypothetical protein